MQRLWSRLHMMLYATVLLLPLMSGCHEGIDMEVNTQVHRVEYASSGSGPLRVLLVWPEERPDDLFFEGAELAIAQINAAGGLLGRPLEGVRLSEPATPNEVTFAVRAAVHDPMLFAAIGHRGERSATVASVNYEFQKILFIATAATTQNVTGHDFNMTFRTIPDNSQTTEELIHFALRENWRRIAIINTRDPYGEELSELFSKHAAETPITIPFRKSFFSGAKDLRGIIAQMKRLPLDAIFFGGVAEDGGHFIRQLEEMRLKLPILGAGGLDSNALLEIAGISASNGTVVPTHFHQAQPLAVRFSEQFMNRYRQPPTTIAATAYDAIRLLEHGVVTGRSAVPEVLAVTLRYLDPWYGITGLHQFTEQGNNINKMLYFKTLWNGEYYFIPE